MVAQDGGYNSSPPIGAPTLLNVQGEDHLGHFDNSVNAVSFGFVATAVLISMFLVMAIFERLLRPSSDRSHGDLESQIGVPAKLGHPSPKMTVYANGVSVLMPGDNIPTFIAHPAPVSVALESAADPHELFVTAHHISSLNHETVTSSREEA
ncbi:hypothetical protein K2173_004363 [Erythroxylum novogranatense]|uniref:Transmembrane protein n=1 Tax=Erythroxylum novogranatense TaxID=1862640 RepID=A0AAV8T4A8_9ROSI|nr:hypothetical protein K2173_004363 [Erythroxylum novogranatense]